MSLMADRTTKTKDLEHRQPQAPVSSSVVSRRLSQFLHAVSRTAHTIRQKLLRFRNTRAPDSESSNRNSAAHERVRDIGILSKLPCAEQFVVLEHFPAILDRVECRIKSNAVRVRMRVERAGRVIREQCRSKVAGRPVILCAG